MLHNLISRIGLGLYAWLVILYLLFPLAVLIAASFTATDFLAFPQRDCRCAGMLNSSKMRASLKPPGQASSLPPWQRRSRLF